MSTHSICFFVEKLETYQWFLVEKNCSTWNHVLKLCITKTCIFKQTENFTTKKCEIFQIKNSNIFHISAQNIDCGYTLEPPQ